MGHHEVEWAGGDELLARTGARAQHLRTMASSLLAMAEAIDNDAGATSVVAGTAAVALGFPVIPSRQALLDQATQDYAHRRARRRHFPADLFGEPAWDLLLDLFQARLEGKMISVTSACIAADVPLSTALRWIGVLESAGLVDRRPNAKDSRSTWVSLTDRAVASMTDYFEGCLARERRTERLAEESLIAIRANQAA